MFESCAKMCPAIEPAIEIPPKLNKYKDRKQK